MRSFFLHILKGILVVVISAIFIYGAIFYFITGKSPTDIKEFRKVVQKMMHVRPNEKLSANSEVAGILNQIQLEDDFSVKKNNSSDVIDMTDIETDPTDQEQLMKQFKILKSHVISMQMRIKLLEDKNERLRKMLTTDTAQQSSK